VLYRVFPMLPGAAPAQDGGPLFVDRSLQGSGRHDNPNAFAALYASRQPESAVAERIKWFQGRIITNDQLRRADGRSYALAALDDRAIDGVIDLDDPRELLRLGVRPSQVATHTRSTTQRIAMDIFDEGASGLGWWSTIESSWPNVTLFAERAIDRLVIAGEPEPLSVDHSMVVAAAQFLDVRVPR
jgi:RES domain